MGEPSFLSQNKWAIWLIIISMLVIAAVAYFIFRPVATQRKANISLSIDAPDKTPSGGQISYVVHVANKDTDPVTGVTLDMIYPSGFTFSQSNPPAAKLDGTLFNIPDLAPGVEIRIQITGTLNGNSGELKTISGVMHYKFANFNGDFFAQAQSRSQITDSNIALQFDGPASTNNDQTVVYNLTYTNTASHDLSNIVVQLTKPDAFVISTLDPQPDSSGQTVWTLPDLHAGQSGVIKITGRFTNAQVGNQQAFAAEADGRDDNGQPIVFSNASFLAMIGSVPLEADLAVTDQNSSANTGQGFVFPGDTLNYTVHYKNNNTVAMTGVVLNVKLTGDALDLASLRAQNGSVNNSVITWDGSQVGDFNSLAPNQEGNLNFVISVKNPATRTTAQNLTVAAHTEIKSTEITQAFVGKDLSLKIQTVPTVEAAISFSGGSNPPRVNQTTTYLLTINLRNSTNDINNAVLTLNLPNSLGFDKTSISAAEQQNVSYDGNTRKITWNVGTLPAHTGDFKVLRRLQFAVTIEPSAASVGQPITLANHIELNGTDSFTSQGTVKDISDLSSISDPTGKGIVSQ